MADAVKFTEYDDRGEHAATLRLEQLPDGRVMIQFYDSAQREVWGRGVAMTVTELAKAVGTTAEVW